MKALRAARLFDGCGDRVIERPVVLVAGGVIAEVRELGVAPDGVAVTDLGDVTLLPGTVTRSMPAVIPPGKAATVVTRARR